VETLWELLLLIARGTGRPYNSGTVHHDNDDDNGNCGGNDVNITRYEHIVCS
jgi:hypothetical protein